MSFRHRLARRRAAPPTPLARGTTTARRLVARHPWLYWLAVAVLAAATAATMRAELNAVGAARDAWGTRRGVLVATTDLAPGEPIAAARREVPAAVVPASAVDPAHDLATLVARQRVTTGEILTDADVTASGPMGLVPAGWLAVPVVEAPPSGAAIGDRIRVASDGIVVSEVALVVDRFDDVTLVAVPADAAPMLPPAADGGGLTLLREP